MEGVVLKIILSFALILVLLFGFVFLLKKFYMPYGLSGSSGVEMKIYGALHIQPKKSIYLVKILNKVLVVGVTENSVNLLAEFSDPEIVRALDEIYLSSSSSRAESDVLKILKPGRG